MLKDLLFIDIETVPAVPSFIELDPVWQSLFCDKTSKTVPEDMAPMKLIEKGREF